MANEVGPIDLRPCAGDLVPHFGEQMHVVLPHAFYRRCSAATQAVQSKLSGPCRFVRLATGFTGIVPPGHGGEWTMAEGAMPLGTYTAEMRAELDRLATLIEDDVDFDRPPDRAMRALDERNNAVWNVDLPAVAVHRHITLPADEELDAAFCDAVVYVPENAGPGVIFYVHGGGWSLMSLATHERLMRVLSIEARMPLVGVHYRLAPEHPYPAALRDVVGAFRAIQARRADYGLPPGPVVVAGDSAGANLALAMMLREADADRPLPAGALLFYGVFGSDFDTPSYRAYAEGHRLTRTQMQRFWDWYDPGHIARTDPLAAPLAASDERLRLLPPLFLIAAEIDPLASDTYALRKRLDAVAHQTELLVEPGVIHGYLQMTAVLAAARRGIRAAAAAANRFVAAVG